MVAVSGFLGYVERQQEIKEQMLMEAKLINKSVEWLNAQIDQKLLEIEVAESHYNFADLDRIKSQVMHLLAKLRQEDSFITGYMAKYREVISNEEKALLSGLSQEKSLSVWSFSPYPSRTTQGTGISSTVKT